jgi:hypothetical protein
MLFKMFLASACFAEADFVYGTLGLSGTYAGDEAIGIIDDWARTYVNVAVTGPVSSWISGSLMMGWFMDDLSEGQVYDAFSSGFLNIGGIGMSAGAGVSYDVYGDVNGYSYHAIGIGGLNINPYIIIGGSNWPF